MELSSHMVKDAFWESVDGEEEDALLQEVEDVHL